MKETDKICLVAVVILVIPIIIAIYITFSSQYAFSQTSLPVVTTLSSNNSTNNSGSNISKSQSLSIAPGSPIVIGKGTNEKISANYLFCYTFL